MSTHHIREKISYSIAIIIIAAMFLGSIYYISGLLHKAHQYNKYLQPITNQNAPTDTP